MEKEVIRLEYPIQYARLDFKRSDIAIVILYLRPKTGVIPAIKELC